MAARCIRREDGRERSDYKRLGTSNGHPQMVILNLPSVGAFPIHCGWNPVIEGIIAGLPMITWPGFADQFFNEKLVTQVLKIGVGVGVTEWVDWQQDWRPLVKRDGIERAIRKVEGGEEAEEMRKRGMQLKEMAKSAVEEGGSSHLSITHRIDDIKKLWLSLNHLNYTQK